jgi:hypothetical protein
LFTTAIGTNRDAPAEASGTLEVVPFNGTSVNRANAALSRL